jgi:hypothetical protein
MSLAPACAILLASCAMSPPNDNPPRLTSPIAYRYALAWSRSASLPTDQFHVRDGGDFQGRLRAVDFEYTADPGCLIVRATVTPLAAYAVDEPTIMTELQRRAKEDPSSVARGRFELHRVPWENPEKLEPSIFLRRDFTDSRLSEREFTAAIEELRTAAYRWGHMKLQQVIRDAMRKAYPK